MFDLFSLEDDSTLPDKRECESRSRLVRRRKSEIADVIRKNTQDLTEDEKKLVLIRALKDTDTLQLVLSENKPKPRGITRTSDETVNNVWNFWVENSTVSNNKTERTSKMSLKRINENPLLSRIDKNETNIGKLVNIRNV